MVQPAPPWDMKSLHGVIGCCWSGCTERTAQHCGEQLLMLQHPGESMHSQSSLLRHSVHGTTSDGVCAHVAAQMNNYYRSMHGIKLEREGWGKEGRD